MIKDAGGELVIVGHSERRTNHGETDAIVAAKASAVSAYGLPVIVCIGETEAERDAGETLAVLSRQLEGSAPDDNAGVGLVIAYEPVWAIGTGRTPSSQEILEAHAHIRQALSARYAETGSNIPILYGGSMKPANAGEILALDNVNGGLIGGASLKASDLLAIAQAAPAA